MASADGDVRADGDGDVRREVFLGGLPRADTCLRDVEAGLHAALVAFATSSDPSADAAAVRVRMHTHRAGALRGQGIGYAFGWLPSSACAAALAEAGELHYTHAGMRARAGVRAARGHAAGRLPPESAPGVAALRVALFAAGRPPELTRPMRAWRRFLRPHGLGVELEVKRWAPPVPALTSDDASASASAPAPASLDADSAPLPRWRRRQQRERAGALDAPPGSAAAKLLRFGAKAHYDVLLITSDVDEISADLGSDLGHLSGVSEVGALADAARSLGEAGHAVLAVETHSKNSPRSAGDRAGDLIAALRGAPTESCHVDGTTTTAGAGCHVDVISAAELSRLYPHGGDAAAEAAAVCAMAVRTPRAQVARM